MSTLALGLACYVTLLGAAIERPARQSLWIACAYTTVSVCTVFAVLGWSL